MGGSQEGAANRQHKRRTTRNKHLGNFSRLERLCWDMILSSVGRTAALETAKRPVFVSTPSKKWLKETVHVNGLHKKLNSLGTETCLMEMMLAGAKSALTRQAIQSASRPNETSGIPRGHRFLSAVKGRISKQWISGQPDHIGDKATKKNNALNWATTVIDCFFTQWFKVWDQRNLDRHGLITKVVPTSWKTSLICAHSRKQSLKTSGACSKHR